MAADDVYKKVYKIMTEKVSALEEQVNTLKDENANLSNQLAIAKGKLEVYERLVNVSSTDAQLGFAPNPMS